jgi:hypothetical protein
MKISELILALEKIKENNGDLKVVKYADEESSETKKRIAYEISHLDLIVEKNSQTEFETIEKGCKCLSCWTYEKYNEDILVIE